MLISAPIIAGRKLKILINSFIGISEMAEYFLRKDWIIVLVVITYKLLVYFFEDDT